MLKEIINDFDVNRFTRFFREKNRAFAPRQEDLFHYDDENFSSGLKLGEIKFTDAEELIICTFKVMKSLTERSGKKAQYEKAKKILKETRFDLGIFIFYDQNGNFRFSLIYANYLGTKRDWSNFRRFTYFVCKEFTNKTFLQRIGKGDFSSLEKIKDAFSVEKVTKQFYKDISYWYFWAIQNAEFPKDAEEEKNGRNIATIRLITRLIFIWFMRERKLISGNLFDYPKIKQILKDISPGKTTYYKAILQNLFFATLNTKERKYRFQITGWKNSSYMDHSFYRYKDYFINSAEALIIFKEIPFLNGGLFDCLDRPSKQNNNQGEVRIDGFSDKEVGLKFPNFLFFSEETNTDLNKDFGTKNKNYKVQGLINILSAYNFTIDENEPNDQEVALDPELLGKVFENLLASFNPETSSTARKATGSYYTPREIVDYMVTQSIKEYLKTHLKDIEGLDKKLNDLFATGKENNPFTEQDTKYIVKLIDALRIVDPAVGSGAFPMGILNKLVFILSKLDPENSLWKETQINAVAQNVPDPVIKQDLINQIEIKFREKNPDYGRKLYLIQKCIYGVDIQQIAVEIAKLRFFISLLVDEKIDKSKDNWGIEALPNLDFKIMQGNSLISEFMGINFDDDENKNNGVLSFEDETDQLIKLFKEKKNEFQNESDKRKKDKLTKEIEDLIIQIFETKLQKQKANYFSQLNSIENKYSTLPNEDYRNEMIAKEKHELYKKTGFNLDEVEKKLREFTSGNKTKPFFLWKLYFAEVFTGENPGFDIVIANPPYVPITKIVLEDRKIYTNKYRSAVGRFNLFYFFLELTGNITKSKGTSHFIVPDRLLLNTQVEGLRSWLLKENQIIEIVSFDEVVFEAVVDSILILFSNNKNEINEIRAKNKVTIKTLQTADNLIIPIEYFTTSPSMQFDLNYNVNTFRLIKKIQNQSLPLEKLSETKDGIIQGAVDDILFLSNPIDTDSKRLLFGKDINRYCLNFNNNWISYKPLYMMIIEKERVGVGKGPGLRLRKPEIFEREKILSRQTADRIIATLDDSNYYYSNTLHGTSITDENFNIKFVLGILNSKVLNWYYKSITAESGKVFAQIKIALLRKLPIFNAQPQKQQSIILLLDQILIDKKASKDTQKLEDKIDLMVYKLYELSYEEVKIVDAEFDKVLVEFGLSKADYERMSVEELSKLML